MPRTPGRYGRRPNDPSKPRLHLGTVLTGTVPAHDDKVDYLARLTGWQMLGNDEYGDCVAVTWANTRRLVTAALAAEHYPSMDDVIAVYKTQNPRFPSQDDGMVIQDLLGYLTKTPGPDGVKALAFAQVDHTNDAEVKAAIDIFGSVWTGIWVSAANEDEFSAEQPWDYVRRSPNLGGHSVIVGGYDSDGKAGDERLITWAEETSFTDSFWTHQVDEAWVVVWPEHLGTRAFKEGIDQQALADAYETLTGRPFPVQPQPQPGPPEPPGPAAPSGADVAAAVRQLLTNMGFPG